MFLYADQHEYWGMNTFYTYVLNKQTKRNRREVTNMKQTQKQDNSETNQEHHRWLTSNMVAPLRVSRMTEAFYDPL